MRDRERLAVAGVAITVGFSGLALGGAVRWAAITGSVCAIASAIPFVTSRRVGTTRSLLLGLLAIAIGLTAIQLIPLPSSIAGVLASEKLDLVTDNAAAWRLPEPSTVMASYDPPATLVELAKLVGYAALGFAAARISSERRTRRVLGMVIVGATVAVSLVTLAHALFGATQIYGVFAPAGPHVLVSPIINDNHFASLMALAVPIALALAVTADNLARAMWLGAALLCTVSCLLVASRGGAIGLVIGLAVTATLMLVQRRTPKESGGTRKRISVTALVIGACTVILVGALAANQVTSELSATRLDSLTSDPHWKVQAWRHASDMLGDNAWLGTGRGAFEPAYSRWAPVGDTAYAYAENTYLQVAVDWGIPGALAIGVAAIMVAIACARRWKQTPLEAAALGSLAALAVHDFVDFSIELPVVAMAAILLVAILLPTRLDSGKAPKYARAQWVRGGLFALALAVCAVAATSVGQDAHAAAAAERTAAAPGEQLARAADAVARHPSDYLLMGRAAQLMMTLGDPRAVSVVSRALYLNPSHAGLHRLAATLLLRGQQRVQAQVELALAIEFAPDAMLRELVEQIAATFPDPTEAAHAFPIDPEQAERIDVWLSPHKALAFAYAQRLAWLNPSDFRAQLLFANNAIAAGHPDLALGAARDAYKLKVTTASAIMLANARAIHGDNADAVATLRAALADGIAQSQREHFDLVATIADVELASGSLGPAALTLDELGRIVADTDESISLHLHRALLHDHLGEANRASWERAEAAKLQSGGP